MERHDLKVAVVWKGCYDILINYDYRNIGIFLVGAWVLYT